MFDLAQAAGSVVRGDLAQMVDSGRHAAAAGEGDRAGSLVVVAAGDAGRSRTMTASDDVLSNLFP